MKTVYRLHNRRRRWTLTGTLVRIALFGLATLAFDVLLDGQVTWPRTVASWLIERPAASDSAANISPQIEAADFSTANRATKFNDYDLTGRVVKVIDGDSILIASGLRTTEVRLHGIDAPEHDQPGGAAAEQALRRMIGWNSIGLVVKATDTYGRTVAVVYRDGANINAEMVRQGHAWWYRRYAQSDRELRDAENDARATRRGVWKAEKPVAPWEWRRKGNR